MLRCLCQTLDTSLKAIHNHRRCEQPYRRDVYAINRYKFESNSQPSSTVCSTSWRCLCYYVDTSLKAIQEVKERRCKDTHYILIHKILASLFSSESLIMENKITRNVKKRRKEKKQYRTLWDILTHLKILQRKTTY